MTPPKILVADDDKVTRTLLEKALRKTGATVILASDGIRARTVLEDNPDIRVLITDVMMPGLDGRDLVAGLRREERFNKLEVLVMSATVGIKEIRKLLELGASRFLAKPIDLKLLNQEVTSMLE